MPELELPRTRYVTFANLRHWLSQGLGLIALGWLVLMPLIYAMLYLYASKKGLYPAPQAPDIAPMGPWVGEYFLEEGVRQLMFLPVNAALFALLSLIVKPNRRSALLLGLCAVVFLLTFGPLLGLIED